MKAVSSGTTFKSTTLIYESLIKIKNHRDSDSKQPGVCGGWALEVKSAPFFQINFIQP